MARRIINVYFAKEYKHVFNKNNKKSKNDYILNIDKITRERLNNESALVLNPLQAFILNYEIKKLLDKAITISNQKYDNIIYVNAKLNVSSILNIIQFLNKTYVGSNFHFMLIDKSDEYAKKHFDRGIVSMRKLKIMDEYVRV